MATADRLLPVGFARKFPHPALVFVVLVWGLNFPVIKFALDEWTPKSAMLGRYLLMMPLIILLAVATKQWVSLPTKEWGKATLAGGLANGAYMVLFLEGMARVGAAQGAVLLATAPIWISLFAIIAKQEIFRWQLGAGLLVAYGGVATVVLTGKAGSPASLVGFALVLASAVVWAISVILMKPLLTGRPALGVFSATFPGGALILLPYGLKDLISTDFSAVTLIGWTSMGYLTLLAGVGAFAAYYIAVRDIGPARTGMAQYFIPIVAAIGAWVLRNEALSLVQWSGIMTVVGGVALARWGQATIQKAALVTGTGPAVSADPSPCTGAD